MVRDTAEEDVLLESLIENLHRKDLNSVEEENAVYKLWETRRWKTHAELGKALGKSRDWVRHRLSAKKIRGEAHVDVPTISTERILAVGGLGKEDREAVLKKVKEGEIKTREVREYARVLKKAPEPIKKALLKPKSRITAKVAEKILELPKELHAEAVKHIETLKLGEEEAIDRSSKKHPKNRENEQEP